MRHLSVLSLSLILLFASSGLAGEKHGEKGHVCSDTCSEECKAKHAKTGGEHKKHECTDKCSEECKKKHAKECKATDHSKCCSKGEKDAEKCKGAKEGAKKPAETGALKAQETCPVMGGVIDKKTFVDYEGKRVYLCCGGCEATFKKDPAKYLKKLEESGQKPEEI